MMNTKKISALIVLLLLIGCSPETPTTQVEEADETPTVSALSTVDTSEEAEPTTAVRPTVTSEPVLPTATVLSDAESYPEPAEGIVVDAYPAEPVEVVANSAYPESENMADIESDADADVLFVTATEAADGSWTFEVTLEHPDNGWEDYANGWDVITTQGQVLKVDAADEFTRLLTHPHDDEQPVIRSQSGLVLPSDVTEVFVRAHDIVDGWGGEVVYVNLNTSEGDGYEVVRYEE